MVVVVARNVNEVIYYEDVEDGFNVSPLGPRGEILEHWCNQDELRLALNCWIGRLDRPRRMNNPNLKVIGAYRPVISAQTWREQFQVTGDEQITREHFEKLVLIEAVVEGRLDPLTSANSAKCCLAIAIIPIICRSATIQGCSLRTANV